MVAERKERHATVIFHSEEHTVRMRNMKWALLKFAWKNNLPKRRGLGLHTELRAIKQQKM